ncbi:flagellar filament capping protein FliD [Spongiibacter nanhainus]|uniref:Flagellar hook-associated protein 2 n=1 Tax=Spongiibacter nanhainus TaxID=2794344 RepID=A0A7T4R3K1_9GAMM|nr:flagellar filament capping protein FliD [Spongiibacter nanhainus]QQD19724.1 flagellar filament capping protein FliD [Spongiibacter nanhainus]
MASVTATGVGSGLDIGGIVKQLVAAERAPQQTRLDSKEARVQSQLSAYGTLKSSLSSFQSSLSALSDADTFLKRSATVGDKDVFSVTVDTSAAAGDYSVEVEQLATRHKIASAAYADSDTSVGTGQLSITVNGETMTLDIETGGDSLAAIRDAINSSEANPGVSASIVNDQDGAHLVLTADKSGVENTISVSVSTDGSDTGDLAQLDYDPNAASNPMAEKVEALDSIVHIDGFTQTSADLQITDMIEGVTLDLKEARPGESISLSISRDTASITKSVEGFVSNYNKLVTVINDLTAYDPETKTAGLLQGDATVRGIATQLRQALSNAVGGLDSDINTLAELGITTGDNGKLVLDSDALKEVMSEDFNAISQVFSGDDGYASRFDKLIDGLVQTGGLLDIRTQGLEGQIDRIGDQRETLDRRIASIEARYTAQFNALDSLLGQLNSTGEFLTQQLANLPTINSGNKK